MNILSLNMRGWATELSVVNWHRFRTCMFNFACLQETKREDLDEKRIGLLWGNHYVVKPSQGLSGGIFSNWLGGFWSVSFSFMGTAFVVWR